MFLTMNNQLINLQNVSNINILKDRKRIVFNMSHNIELTTPGGETKLISDYVYCDSRSVAELDHKINQITLVPGFDELFVEQLRGEGFINISKISSVKFAGNKNRVIFNLSHPVTFKDFNGELKITSEFVYVNCHSQEKYQEYSSYIKLSLGV